MSTLESIEQAVQKLDSQDLANFRNWFSKFDSDAWDEQISADAKSGKLDNLISNALADYQDGKVREL